MNNEQTLKMTDLDYMTASPHLQMIKAALPYIQVPEQRFFSMFVKVRELERTMKLFTGKEDGAVGICSLEKDEPASPLDMLNAMKPFGSKEEQDFIDLVVNFLQGSQLYQSYKDFSDEAPPASDIPRPDDFSDETEDFSRERDFQEHDSPNGFQQKGFAQDSGAPEPFSQENFSQEHFSEEEGASRSASGGMRNDSRRFPIEQLKNMLPPEQQSKLETAQMLMQSFRQFS